ncbi:hypothetical protein ACOME3_004040 [Neoechinorhynchus agilis]
MEMRMLWSISGLTLRDHIRNKDVRTKYGVTPIQNKLQEAHLRFYGHVLRADDDTIIKTSIGIQIQGRCSKGRPKQRWMEALHQNLKAANVHPDMAHDRGKWRG